MSIAYFVRMWLLASPLLLLAACGGGGSSPTAATPSRVLFQEATGSANIYSVKADGTGIATISDALDAKLIASGQGSLDSQVILNWYTSPNSLNYRPLVLNGRVVYKQNYSSSSYQDIYAAGLDGSARAVLAATTEQETPFALVGERLVYTTYNTTGYFANIHSVLLDGAGDVALTSGTTAGSDSWPIAHIGGKLIYADPDGTHIAQPDGTGKETLWNKQASKAFASGARLVLSDKSEVVAVNIDGSGFASLATGIAPNSLSYSFGAGESRYLGIAGGRLFYNTIDSSANPAVYRLHTIGLDGGNHLVIAESTTAFPYVMEAAVDSLIVQEYGSSSHNIAAYDPATANSRQLLLADGVYMFHSGNRVVGYVNQTGLNSGPYVVSAVNVDGSAATQLTPAISGVDSIHLVLTDGNRIAYRNNSAGGQVEGYAVSLDGTDTKQITSGAGDKELVALIGSKLVYQSYATGNTSAPRNLQGVNLDGSASVDYATTSADDRYLGQDNSQLVFTSTEAGTESMYMIPAAGGVAVLLQSSAASKRFWGMF